MSATLSTHLHVLRARALDYLRSLAAELGLQRKPGMDRP